MRKRMRKEEGERMRKGMRKEEVRKRMIENEKEGM